MTRCPDCQRLIVVDLPEATRFAKKHDQRPEDNARVIGVKAEIERHYTECAACREWAWNLIMQGTKMTK